MPDRPRIAACRPPNWANQQPGREQGRPTFAYDLPQGRSLVGAEITYEGSRPQRHPGMLVTYAGKIALVSCDWDGSNALGVSVGNEGLRGVEALVSVLGEQLCQPWIVASGK